MTPALRVRPARAEDFAAIAALTNHYIRTTPIHFAYDPVTEGELRAMWEKSRERYPWLVATAGDAFAGYAKAGVWRDRTAYSWTPEVGIYVDASRHRTGVGRALYAALLAELQARGFHSAVGGITLPNDASVRLHEAMGFVKVGHFKHAGFKFEQWHDVGFWQVMLGDGPAA